MKTKKKKYLLYVDRAELLKLAHSVRDRAYREDMMFINIWNVLETENVIIQKIFKDSFTKSKCIINRAAFIQSVDTFNMMTQGHENFEFEFDLTQKDIDDLSTCPLISTIIAI